MREKKNYAYLNLTQSLQFIDLDDIIYNCYVTKKNLVYLFLLKIIV